MGWRLGPGRPGRCRTTRMLAPLVVPRSPMRDVSPAMDRTTSAAPSAYDTSSASPRGECHRWEGALALPSPGRVVRTALHPRWIHPRPAVVIDGSCQAAEASITALG